MRKGFTLIELLVVIAIIAILAAILFPVFLKAKESAKTSTCAAHGKELGLAALMYMDDNNARFPCMYTEAALRSMGFGNFPPYDWPYDQTGAESRGPGNAQLMLYQLRRYVKNNDIWLCPDPAPYTLRYTKGYMCSWLPRSTDDPEKGFVNGDRGFCHYDIRSGEVAYAGRTVEEVLALDAKGETICGSRRLTASKKIMFMCYGFGVKGRDIIDPGNWAAGVWPSYPHRDGSIFVYADGHAQQRRMGKGWAPVGYTNTEFDVDPGNVH